MLWEERKGKQVLYMACANGMLRSIEGCDHIIIQEETNSAGEGSHEDVTTQNKFETQPILKKPTKDTAIDDDSDDDVDFTANGAKKSVKFVAEEAEEDNDADTVEMARKEGEAPTTEGTEIRDDHDDGSMGADDYGDDYGGYEERRMTNAPLPEPQPPFAPSATPLDLRRRIMCWNQIGTISYQRDDEGGTRNTVDIDFTEAATRRPISFSDNMDFILGSLGEDGAIFASDLTGDDDDDDEDGKIVDGLNMSERTKKLLKRSLKRRMNKGDGRQPTGSKVYFHRFETFGAPRDKDWLLTLPDGERVIGCACGEGWSAVVTRSVYGTNLSFPQHVSSHPFPKAVVSSVSFLLVETKVKLSGLMGIQLPLLVAVGSWLWSTTSPARFPMERKSWDTLCSTPKHPVSLRLDLYRQ